MVARSLYGRCSLWPFWVEGWHRSWAQTWARKTRRARSPTKPLPAWCRRTWSANATPWLDGHHSPDDRRFFWFYYTLGTSRLRMDPGIGTRATCLSPMRRPLRCISSSSPVVVALIKNWLKQLVTSWLRQRLIYSGCVDRQVYNCRGNDGIISITRIASVQS